jgi:hypothetical protein
MRKRRHRLPEVPGLRAHENDQKQLILTSDGPKLHRRADLPNRTPVSPVLLLQKIGPSSPGFPARRNLSVSPGRSACPSRASVCAFLSPCRAPISYV